MGTLDCYVDKLHPVLVQDASSKQMDEFMLYMTRVHGAAGILRLMGQTIEELKNQRKTSLTLYEVENMLENAYTKLFFEGK